MRAFCRSSRISRKVGILLNGTASPFSFSSISTLASCGSLLKSVVSHLAALMCIYHFLDQSFQSIKTELEDLFSFLVFLVGCPDRDVVRKHGLVDIVWGVFQGVVDVYEEQKR